VPGPHPAPPSPPPGPPTGSRSPAAPRSPAGAALLVQGLSYAYPDGHPALTGVDLLVQDGERVALLGPNGAGKTTFVLHLNGILSAAAGASGAGSVAVSGLPVEPSHLKEIRRRVGLVFQDPDDQLFMPTLRDDVGFGPANLGLRGAELEARVEHALRVVDLLDLAGRPPHHLSYGQRRRAAVATVLAMQPQIIVLDEPTGNLDPAGRRELIELLGRLEVTLLCVTHDLPFALEVCPRSVILDRGRVVADGATHDLLADADLLARHRLELPYGFDSRVLRRGKAAGSLAPSQRSTP
jgi:cobalt/nickel transport system ATP-binding protein